jgi:hypothetical protein
MFVLAQHHPLGPARGVINLFVMANYPMIQAFVVTGVVPASHQMFVLRVLQDMVEVSVNSQFVMENLPILLRFVMVEKEHVCYQMFVRRVLQDMEEVNVKFQFVTPN